MIPEQDNYGLETFTVRLVHWKNKGQIPNNGWRAQMKCDFCKKYQDIPKAKDHSLEGLLKIIPNQVARPLCEFCDKKIKEYKK